MDNFAIRLKKAMDATKTKQVEIVQATGISKSAISQYVSGACEPKQKNTFLIAKALGVSEAWLMGYDVPMYPISDKPPYDAFNILPDSKATNKPLFGTVASGVPMLPTENQTSNGNASGNINADFCILCKGDSMINARIHDGDIIYVKKQPVIENGEIAAVLIGKNTVLKRFYKEENHIALIADNPKYPPLIFPIEALGGIHILGKVVAFTSFL